MGLIIKGESDYHKIDWESEELGKDRPAKKDRLIIIVKQEVYNDIDLILHKFTTGNIMETPRQENAIASDSNEKIDGRIIARYVKFRDSELRKKMRSSLDDNYMEEADDRLDLETHFYYNFNLSEKFNDAILRSLAEYIHRFLVMGALYDWYKDLGLLRQASVYEGELQGLLDSINSLIRTPSRRKTPLQPFGPATKFPF